MNDQYRRVHNADDRHLGWVLLSKVNVCYLIKTTNDAGTSLTAETHSLPCDSLLHFYNIIRTNNCALFTCSENAYCFPLTSLRTCLPFCTFIFEDHTTQFTAMLDATVERERRIRALVVISLDDDHGLEVGASANVRLDTADKKIYIYTYIQVQAFYFTYKYK
jgi:hypothetical protein